MLFKTFYSKKKVIEILNEQVDPFPRLSRCLITLNAWRYSGTSRVCGIIHNTSFEKRNRKDPYFSLQAKGEFIESENGTIIRIRWSKPIFFFWARFFRSYSHDKRIIINFFKEWLC